MSGRWPAGDEDVAAIALACGVDALLGEPPAWCHPVVWLGQGIAAAERRAPGAPAAALAFGALVALGGTLACWAGASAALLAVARGAPRLHLPVSALLVKSTFAVRALDDGAERVAGALERGDLAGARVAVGALVSRDTARLDAELVAAAAIESVAENLSDSFVAPLVWYALLGVPGALAYRYANTCDAMLGYRGRYEYLGKAAARVDDALSWLPARVAAGLLVLAAALGGGDGRGAWRTMQRDHARTASPNAGWPMSAAAGALGVRLEKPGHYRLGCGPRPGGAAAIRRAIALARRAAALALAAYCAGALLGGRRAAAT